MAASAVPMKALRFAAALEDVSRPLVSYLGRTRWITPPAIRRGPDRGS